ncbi:MAG TPA: C39 family peptidase [Candidatus Limnocylindria bacterium]|nr:C39 family peptidase [Candidatus Limnocylindria bacterium]
MYIKHPKADMIEAAIGFIILAAAALFLFRIVEPLIVPARLILAVPFSPQAPTNNWSRNEDCEETSITMANAYLTHNFQDKLPAAATQEAINNLKKWEGKNLGYNANTGADATTKMAEGAFGLKIRQITNFTENDLKAALMNNQPILLPINAKLLGSKQYTNDGPTYHMIVLRGFKGDIFIVNDPGTNNGDGNEYSFAVLKKAASDWEQNTKSIDNSKKIALVVSK